jgi:hypothetical protein
MEKRFRPLLFAGIGLTCVLGFVFPNRHPHFWWQKIPIYDALFGLAGSIVIIYFAKWLGHRFLMRDEDYYD